MLNPYRVMVIDATPFSKNKEQDFDWFKPYNHFICTGFPKNHDVVKFIDGLTHVLVCENPYNFYLLHACREKGIKTFVQTNYEFCENLNNPHLPLPDKFLMPSYWMVEDMKKRFGEERVEYLPPPIDTNEFDENAKINMERKGKKRFLHVVGTLAFRDRNGTWDVLNALKYCKEDFELVITSQHPLPEKYKTSDPRVKFEIGEKKTNVELYRDFDVLILPRRYGGLCLTLNEAMMSGLIPIMPDISPNNQLLHPNWLIAAEKMDVIHARELIDVYTVHLRLLGEKMDELATKDLEQEKALAYSIAMLKFSTPVLKPKYEKLWN